MTTRSPTYTDAEHKKLAVYFLRVMEAVRDGVLAPDDAREEVMQCIAALDKGDYDTPLNHAQDPADRIKVLARLA
jgi:hypothetical protein